MVVILPIAAAAIAKDSSLGIWVGLWLSIAGVVLVWEEISKFFCDRSLSQVFYQFTQKHRAWGTTLVGFMTLGWIMLMAHLLWNIPAIWN